MFYEEINKRTWNGARDYLTKLTKNNSFWIFRGQSNPNWPLITTIERELNFNSPIYDTIENELINEFKRSAHLYIQNNQMPETEIEWLALMQHHGAPTRLIDFTKSPYIATYFSLENMEVKNKYVSVWAIDSYQLLQYSINFIMENKKYTGKTPIKEIHFDSDEMIRSLYKNNRNFIHPIEPGRRNERFNLQQGTFLITSNINSTFEENIMNMNINNIGNIIKKINIPVSERENIVNDLFLMNITPATLFPGLDGLARTIRKMPEIINTKLYMNFIKNRDKKKEK